jgi:NAD(P)-dependent dehydrogenase (short-subunit alcohol dehydrogenase family)
MVKRPVAFITGASRGIGRAIALELAASGFDLAGCARSYDPGNPGDGLTEVQSRVEAAGAAFLPLKADISRLDLHEALYKEILERFGRIDVLVNNAGVGPKVRLDILETTPESYDRALSINTRGPFFLTQCFARRMASQDREEGDITPCIIFISSVSAYMSSPNRAEYCLSKAALSHASRIFAHRLAEVGVNVYEVQPGIIATDMTAPVKEKYDTLIQEGLIPMKRWGRPEDVARAVAALARGDFPFSTGMVVDVSGGMHIQRL